MKFSMNKVNAQNRTLAYEQPNLRRYGTMKSLTLAQNGSGSDFNQTFGGEVKDFSQGRSDTGNENTTVD